MSDNSTNGHIKIIPNSIKEVVNVKCDKIFERLTY